jgi:hypothetical protein
MPRRKTIIILSAGLVLACSGVLYAFDLATRPLRDPIYLESAGSPHHDDSERDVCAKWFGSPDKWWVAVEKDSSVYSELRSARHLQFETDIGSGLSDVCRSEEVDFKMRPELVKEVLASCDRGGWHAKPKYERQVVFHLASCPAIAPSGGEQPRGTPAVREVPPN